jgi:hypothetical protein
VAEAVEAEEEKDTADEEEKEQEEEEEEEKKDEEEGMDGALDEAAREVNEANALAPPAWASSKELGAYTSTGDSDGIDANGSNAGVQSTVDDAEANVPADSFSNGFDAVGHSGEKTETRSIGNGEAHPSMERISAGVERISIMDELSKEELSSLYSALNSRTPSPTKVRHGDSAYEPYVNLIDSMYERGLHDSMSERDLHDSMPERGLHDNSAHGNSMAMSKDLEETKDLDGSMDSSMDSSMPMENSAMCANEGEGDKDEIQMEISTCTRIAAQEMGDKLNDELNDEDLDAAAASFMGDALVQSNEGEGAGETKRRAKEKSEEEHDEKTKMAVEDEAKQMEEKARRKAEEAQANEKGEEEQAKKEVEKEEAEEEAEKKEAEEEAQKEAEKEQAEKEEAEKEAEEEQAQKKTNEAVDDEIKGSRKGAHANQRPWRESIEMEEDLDMATASMMADPFAIHLGGGGSEEGSDEGSDDKLDDEGGANKDGGTEDGGEDEKQDWTKADQLAADEQLQFLAALDGFDDDNSSSFSASLGSGLLGLLGGP